MANEQTRGTTDFATQSSEDQGDVKGRAREVVQQAKDRAGERIESRITDSKSRAAETLSGVASTLLSSSQQLREQNHSGAGRAVERAAEGVERFAHYLQDTNVDEVVDQVYDFARRQPAAFIGGAFALGFLASRFIKATTPEGARRQLPAASDYGRGYETSYRTSRSYQGGYGDTSGSSGYGAGPSPAGGGTTGGGYGMGSGYDTADGASTTGTVRNTDDLGDGSPGLAGARTPGASRTGAAGSDADRTGGSDAGPR